MSFASDTFTDAEGTLLQNHVGEQGGGWVKHSTSTADATITGNEVASPGAALYYSAAVPATAEYDVTVRVDFNGSSQAVPQSGPAGQISTTANTCYRANYKFGASQTWQLWKTVAGSNTVIGQAGDTSVSAVNTPLLTLQLRSGSQKLLVDGTEKIVASDTTISAAGRAGLWIGAGSHKIDDFTATDAASGSTLHTVAISATSLASPAFSDHLRFPRTLDAVALTSPSLAFSLLYRLSLTASVLAAPVLGNSAGGTLAALATVLPEIDRKILAKRSVQAAVLPTLDARRILKRSLSSTALVLPALLADRSRKVVLSVSPAASAALTPVVSYGTGPLPSTGSSAQALALYKALVSR